MSKLEIVRKKYKRLCNFRKVLYSVAVIFAVIALFLSVFNLVSSQETASWFVYCFFNGKRATLIFAIPIACVEWRLRKIKKDLLFLEECYSKPENDKNGNNILR